MALCGAASSSDALSWAERWLAAKTELADGVGTLLLVFHDPDFVAGGGGNWSDGNFGGSGLQPQIPSQLSSHPANPVAVVVHIDGCPADTE